jgi:hypothetical protein
MTFVMNTELVSSVNNRENTYIYMYEWARLESHHYMNALTACINGHHVRRKN